MLEMGDDGSVIGAVSPMGGSGISSPADGSLWKMNTFEPQVQPSVISSTEDTSRPHFRHLCIGRIRMKKY